MKYRARMVGSLMCIVMATAGAAPAESVAAAQAAKTERADGLAAQHPVRILFDDSRMRVQEIRFRPGDVGPGVRRPLRVVRVLAGGTMQRVYPDGRTEKVEYRDGDVKVYEPDGPVVLRNIGATDIVLFVVAIREAAQ